jgi:pimeloyl-ACP methyl ester carboxylesterase
VSGHNDTQYDRLAAAMASDAPDGIHRSIRNAGHNVLLDAPDELARVVLEFLDA